MKPYDKGHIKVSDGHRLYYERCGSRSGIPVVFLHGGPGGGFIESHKEAFDFNKFDVLFFDQRGAGRSKPFASTKANTTSKLVGDINYLLDHFKIEKPIVYGGSWGSTLALVYAIRNLKRVSGLVLRGIFLSTPGGMKHYFGGGVKTYAPEAWERFISHVPREHRKNILEYYYQQMRSKNKATRQKYAYEFAYYEISISCLKSMSEKQVDQLLQTFSYESLAILEAHYLRKNCFLPDNYILKNAHTLSNIPVSIVHGRYDLICRPLEAYMLHQKIKGSRLQLVCAGHSSTDPEIKKALKKELRLQAKPGG